ncbi:MAG: hypothetical protein J4G05_06755 [Chlorobi bacterium]|nr:hypothetical protein [Chlorobiota bacterium]
MLRTQEKFRLPPSVAIITISSFTEAVAASPTVSELETDVKGVSDLPRVRVGAVYKATGAT